MAHIIWTGHVSFGMVWIPVALYAAARSDDLSFSMLDKRDHAAIGYRKINKSTGQEVQSKDIVKGYEFEKGNYVLVTPEDLARADAKATQTIEILDFVDLAEIPPQMFERPYWLSPRKKGEKPYRLLSAILEESNKVGIATVVLSNRQHLAAVMARGPVLLLEVLRFSSELAEPDSVEIDEGELQKVRIGDREKALARKLLDEMTTKFDPSAYHDEFRDRLRQWLQQKARSKGKGVAKVPSEKVVPPSSNVINLMDVLKQSLGQRSHASPTSRDRRPRGRKRA